MIGAVLAGKYRIEKKLGEGAFGVVYSARDQNLDRTVAVKIMRASQEETLATDRSKLEWRSLALLNHPNIVTVFDSGHFDGFPYAVMEYVDGVVLYDLANRTLLSSREICQIAREVCKALAYAHEKGVVHRDLTLKNIMVDARGDGEWGVKVVDFGLVKMLESGIQTAGRDLLGTPAYMSPEQVTCGPIDGRTDIFSFGVGLFRLLQGHYPFEAEHPTAVMYQIVNEPEIIFDQDLDPGLQKIIRRCLEKDPDRRYQDFSSLLSDLDDFERDCAPASVRKRTVPPVTAALERRGSRLNPYLHRVMIRNDANFYGREREIRKIYSRLDAPHPQSISIVGDRRIGKSSLLNYLYQRSQRKAHMQNYRTAIFAYLDFQGRTDFTVPKFIDFLFNVFSYDTEAAKSKITGDRTLEQLREAVHALHGDGRRVIVLIDEFESITRNPNFDTSFFSFLRSIANNYRVAYVTSSCDELQHVCHNQDISESPFFNIFSNLPLLPFTRDEALELIREPSAREGVPLEPYADRILSLSGLFPLYIQIACSAVFENLIEDEAADPDWDWVERIFKDEAYPHFEFTWEAMTEIERKNLTRFAEGRRISRKYEFVNERLQRRGYLMAGANGPVVFSTSFRDFILSRGKTRSRKKFDLGRLFGRGD
jgi:serine/threonine protein kinase